MNGPDIDTYVFVRDRRPQTVLRFLDCFLPDRRPLHDEIEAFMTDFEEPTASFSPTALLEEAEHNNELRAVLYFVNRRKETVEYAIVSYTKDGGTIFGLSTHWDHPDAAVYMLAAMQLHFGVPNGYSFTEDYPRDSEADFRLRETDYNDLTQPH